MGPRASRAGVRRRPSWDLLLCGCRRALLQAHVSRAAPAPLLSPAPLLAHQIGAPLRRRSVRNVNPPSGGQRSPVTIYTLFSQQRAAEGFSPFSSADSTVECGFSVDETESGPARWSGRYSPGHLYTFHNQSQILLPGVCKHMRNLTPVFLSRTRVGKTGKIHMNMYILIFQRRILYNNAVIGTDVVSDMSEEYLIRLYSFCIVF